MNYLLIDTSNQPLSVALMQDEKVLIEQTTNIKQNHSVQLMPETQKLFEQSQVDKQEITDIVVAEGPGSYTGLRIGVTVAKTLAYALQTRLYGVSSLKALAATIKDEHRLLVPIFDARREAVYTGVYQYVNGELTTIIEDGYLSINDLKDKLHALNQEYVFIGFNLENIKHLLDSEVIESLPKASVMKSLIQQPENIHSFTPKYHKLSEAERNWLDQQKNN
ncbi:MULTISPECIES: tRNA (adenosine(37)-N6)-threonylcarbamoyltransferase complex dimerization subunit type 1 TsaB [Staphylococcus]|jgi:tRNA threonylcarbamoyl adenosine modification protein YeaZ|uniref:tRNA (adenosine(37)-N6)-threonylcarbamoyltransferase complex dimerization subunit type 1 TsaB n=1 Tax=Staphylococcus TaxID=1279 RepID=UPI0001EF488F|nr:MULTISPECIES: tRNA (adenosine(37)-N6)-threonylcarbamoyltransferase complex dimerization subunit type 1 TsaB [Staphylococcus]EFS16994.1 peptidase, putative, M22 (O-sialoglycoprotein endopeptidase) family [Staphylococcus capitis C87]MBC3050072.1 tRNA (adenosine(37)-N6)-threonylcarbamoyltransferase complex dimerization subunit type 1 TsaB [Staphylococcus capitis]MBC3070050.1 tRNA (adenosine(37)-N6)-threonylcarbamoyltransferase complex dimerization subunit type 1 TsaB [Staphylococcus capitis]MBC